METLRIAGQTDVGRQRRDNQDAFICEPIWTDDTALLAVIDGVGGYAGGDIAATIARDAICHYMAEPTGDPLTMLREAVVYANNQIDQRRRSDPSLSMMCCVLTAAIADARQQKVWFAHVGDTRLYRIQLETGHLQKLTSDHSVVGVREDANQLTEAQAMQHPRRNEVLRTVGSALHRVDDADFLESGESDFSAGEGLLLCSDGLTDMLTSAEVVNVLNRETPPDEQITELIRQANEVGGQDNITVVLALHTADSAASNVISVEPVTVEPVEAVYKATPTGPLPPLVTPVPVATPPEPVATKPAGNRWWLLVVLALALGLIIYWLSGL